MAEGEYIIVYEKSYDEGCERGERGCVDRNGGKYLARTKSSCGMITTNKSNSVTFQCQK